ncbi:hypothetical protein CO111_00195 [Candidatus Desantisbacteria bacterium CG_4_9_14_3_um_filter_50_7]|nr:MAG: hypothetical protein CO111_00195 [Candidatus Desantisbacteria bacterium CG_4_9_14_3_um_filter_50_7]
MADRVMEAEDLVERITGEALKESGSGDLSKVLVILPNKRPAYYITGMLAEKLGRAFFPPRVLSIAEFIECEMLEVRPGSVPASQMDEIWLLYRAIRENGLFEGFDFHKFYFWGLKIASVLSELEMEDVPDGKLKNLPTENIPKEAKNVISRLGEIKAGFRKALEQHGFHTPALGYRVVSETPADTIAGGWDKIILAGFYKSTRLEQKVLDLLRGQKKTLEIKRKAETAWKTGNISIHSAFDIHSQVKTIGEILKGLQKDFSSTAVVMPQPDALVPVLWNVLEDLDCPYNVTMGYPLKRTPVFTFLNELMKLQETKTDDGYYARSYLSVLLHPYLKNASKDAKPEEMRMLAQSVEARLTAQNRAFVKLEEIESEFPLLKGINTLAARELESVRTAAGLSRAFSGILSFITKYSFAGDYPFSEEFLECVFRVLEELSSALCKDEPMKKEDLFNLFRYHVDNTRIPFSGIPLKGLQVMGLLETRNLNFRRVIVMDVQEGILPSVSKIDPILPESVRAFLGLPLCKDREEVTRRHFMDLVNSATEAHLVYSEQDRDIRSRFIEEIIWEKQKKEKAGKRVYKKDGEFIALARFSTEIKSSSFEPVPKTPGITEELRAMEYSPTKINSYLNCPAQFYFRYILRLEEKEQMAEDPDASQIGRGVHEILSDLFGSFKGRPYSGAREEMNGMLGETAEKVVEKQFGHLKGNIYLIKEIIKFRLKYLLKKHEELGDFTVLDTEKELKAELGGIGQEPGRVRLHGIIDRIDDRQGEIFIVDYKTGQGAHPDKRKKIEAVPEGRAAIRDFVKSFQLPVYVYLFRHGGSREVSYEKINAAFYNMKEMEESRIFGDKIAYCKGRNREQVMEEVFLPMLRALVSEMLDPDVPFEADKGDKDVCKYCSFSGFCA